MRQQQHTIITTLPRRLRAATAHTPRVASSLLRLSSGASRLPSGADLGQWIGRAARALNGGAV
jgi:hypothetical protein